MQKLWKLHNIITSQIDLNQLEHDGDELDRITNKFIDSVETNLEKFRYNKIIADFHQLFASYSKINLQKYSSLSLKNNYLKILIVMMPVIPHFTNECIRLLNIKENLKWPEVNVKSLIDESRKYVIQFNGKTKEVIEEKNNLTKHQLLMIIKNNKKLIKYFNDNNKVKKIIFIPNRLINIII